MNLHEPDIVAIPCPCKLLPQCLALETALGPVTVVFLGCYFFCDLFRLPRFSSLIVMLAGSYRANLLGALPCRKRQKLLNAHQLLKLP